MANKVQTFGPLVMDGDTVKLRVQAEREFTGQKVHVDWVRFTCNRRSAPTPQVEVLFSEAFTDSSIWGNERVHRINRELREIPNEDFCAAAQAWELTVQVASSLGPQFVPMPEKRKGMDFYKFRFSIELHGSEVAWIGFLSSGDGPKQSRQSETLHANIHGAACTFAAPGWAEKIADLIDESQATLTRADLALDFFDGYKTGIDSIREAYREGLCNVGGRKLKFNMVGDWENGNNRSVYIGSREAGKITNVYEKGDQLYGEKCDSEWLRFELRYGNKLRVLPSDVLRRPDDFFAGASEWHQMVLIESETLSAAEAIRCKGRLQVETVTAECARNLRWIHQTASASLALAFKVMDESKFLDLIQGAKLPGRLRKFSLDQIRGCFNAAANLVSPAGGSPGHCLAV